MNKHRRRQAKSRRRDRTRWQQLRTHTGNFCLTSTLPYTLPPVRYTKVGHVVTCHMDVLVTAAARLLEIP